MEEAGAESSSGSGSSGPASDAGGVSADSTIDSGVADESTVDSGTSTDWEDLLKEDSVEAAPAVVEAVPATDKPVVEQKSPVVDKPVVEEKPVVEAKVEDKPVVEAKPAVVEQKTPEQVAAAKAEYDTQEAARFEGLVKSYKLPEDMELKLSTEPENVLPYLAARVHANIAAQLAVAMEQMMPRFLQSYTVGNERESAARGAFEKRWPELKGMDKEVLEVGVLYRRLNPTAPPEEAIERIGSMVMQARGLQVSAAAPGAPAAAVAAKPKVFTPAGVAGSRGAAPVVDKNEFSQMAEEFLEDGA